jgi:hypothetical protein
MAPGATDLSPIIHEDIEAACVLNIAAPGDGRAPEATNFGLVSVRYGVNIFCRERQTFSESTP